MKKKLHTFFLRYGGYIAALALTIITVNENSACAFYLYQDELPENAKKLRKF